MTAEITLCHRAGAFTLDAAFDIGASGVTALFGPSGAAQTMIANAIAGLCRPAHGRIVIAKRVLFDSADHVFVPPRGRRERCRGS